MWILHIKESLQKKRCPFGVCSFKNNHWSQQKYHKGKVERGIIKCLVVLKLPTYYGKFVAPNELFSKTMNPEEPKATNVSYQICHTYSSHATGQLRHINTQSLSKLSATCWDITCNRDQLQVPNGTRPDPVKSLIVFLIKNWANTGSLVIILKNTYENFPTLLHFVTTSIVCPT